MPMKTLSLAIGAAAALLALSGCVATARDDRPRYARLDDRDEQVTRTWYHHHRDNPPAGLRNEDRLSADEESRLREGAVLDERLRGKMHAAPGELTRQLRPPARNHRYVMIGGHVGLIDNKNEVKSVIRVYENP
jgi:Ni/Co efflux regulator RcnB